MDRAEPRAGQHGDHRLRHHRHVDDDAVALLHAEVAQDRAEQLHLGQHAAVGEGLYRVGDGGIVDQRRLVVAAGEHVAVERVVAGVAGRAGKPAAMTRDRQPWRASGTSRRLRRPRSKNLPIGERAPMTRRRGRLVGRTADRAAVMVSPGSGR
jgi:hypothetical protein